MRHLIDNWRTKAATVDPSAPAAAHALRECADQLEAELARDNGRRATLQEASDISGYSEDHLQRLVSKGRIPNAGKKNRPRIRHCDIPRKPGHRLPVDEDGGEISARRRIAASVINARLEHASHDRDDEDDKAE